jgi:predicted nucleic acid-binding protein
MSLLVDTSVWSLALRRDRPPSAPEVDFLRRALDTGETVVTTGLVLQELLQGFQGPRAAERIIERFRLLPFVHPGIEDHIAAAEFRNRCRRAGIQLGTIDALIARLCIRYELYLLTTDRDFRSVAARFPLKLAVA